MNNNENISISKLLAVLDIQDDESFIITNVELIDDKILRTAIVKLLKSSEFKFDGFNIFLVFMII